MKRRKEEEIFSRGGSADRRGLYKSKKESASRPSVWTRRWSFVLVGLIVTQLCVGLINLVLLAPIPLQIIHLLLADLMWLSLVLMSASALAQPKEVLETLPPQPNFNPQFSSH